VHGVPISKLGTEAGLSYESVPRLLLGVKDGREFPGAAETYVRLARRWNFSLDWLFDPTPLRGDETTVPTPPASSPPKTRT
jgi:hypothetical protein